MNGLNLEIIDIGTAPDSNDGDVLREAAQKSKYNFQQLNDFLSSANVPKQKYVDFYFQSSGSVSVGVHQCGQTPKVQVWELDLNTGEKTLVEVDLDIDPDGNISWASTSQFTGYLLIES